MIPNEIRGRRLWAGVLLCGLAGSGLSLADQPKTPAHENSPPAQKHSTVQPAAKADTTHLKTSAQAAAPKGITLQGRVVDLSSYMTGQLPSGDPAKSMSDSIKSSVPAVLETSSGIVFLGQGSKGIAEKLAPFARQDVTVEGKLFEKGGVKYLDITTIQKASSTAGTSHRPAAMAVHQ